MGDVRFNQPLQQIRRAANPQAVLRDLSDEDVISALAAASREQDPYMANVLATEAHNRVLRNRAITESLDEGVFAFDLDGRITYLNRGMERLLGYERDDLLRGEGIAEMWRTRERWDRFQELALGSYEEEGVARVEVELRHRTGAALHAEVVITALENALGRHVGFVGVVRDVTRRRQQEAELRASERRFRALFDQTYQFVGLMTPDGILLEANQSALDFGGLRPDDVIGKPFWEARWWSLSAETQARLREAVREAAEGEFVRYEADVRGEGGRVATIDFSIKPIKDESGAVVQLVPEGRDITDRRRIEEALRASEQRFRRVFEQGGLAIGVVGADFRFADANSAMCRLLGYSREELRERTFVDVTHPEDVEKDVLLARRVFDGEIPSYTLEKRFVTRAGDVKWVNLTATVVRDEAGRPVHGLAFVEDVTQRHEAEEALRRGEERARAAAEEEHRLRRELESARERLEVVLHSTGEGIFGIDEEGRLTFVNRGGASMLGYEPAELEGRDFHAVCHALRLDGAPYPASQCPIRMSLQDGLVHRVEGEVFWRKDGSPYPVSYTSTPLQAPGSGEARGVVVVFRGVASHTVGAHPRSLGTAGTGH